MCLQYKPFENTVGKEEIAITSNFSFSHSVLYPFKEISAIFTTLKLSSANSFSLEESKICYLGKGSKSCKVKSYISELWKLFRS